MKVKVTVEMGMMIQNVDLDIPDEKIKDESIAEQDSNINAYIAGWIMRQMKIDWEQIQGG